ncbi:MAG: autotransporter-associated beta strand repeat-containing protein [Opitutales bacterium]|nr:autotransporter-associated beta strand repeat-containing protein [Opitutales bacterium]
MDRGKITIAGRSHKNSPTPKIGNSEFFYAGDTLGALTASAELIIENFELYEFANDLQMRAEQGGDFRISGNGADSSEFVILNSMTLMAQGEDSSATFSTFGGYDVDTPLIASNDSLIKFSGLTVASTDYLENADQRNVFRGDLTATSDGTITLERRLRGFTIDGEVYATDGGNIYLGTSNSNIAMGRVVLNNNILAEKDPVSGRSGLISVELSTSQANNPVFTGDEIRASGQFSRVRFENADIFELPAGSAINAEMGGQVSFEVQTRTGIFGVGDDPIWPTFNINGPININGYRPIGSDPASPSSITDAVARSTSVSIGLNNRGYHTVNVGSAAAPNLFVNEGGTLSFYGDDQVGSSISFPAANIGATGSTSIITVSSFEDTTFGSSNPLIAQDGGKVNFTGIDTLESELTIDSSAIITADGSGSRIWFRDYGVNQVDIALLAENGADILFYGINNRNSDPLARNIFENTLTARGSSSRLGVFSMGGLTIRGSVYAQDRGDIDFGGISNSSLFRGVTIEGDLNATGGGTIYVDGTIAGVDSAGDSYEGLTIEGDMSAGGSGSIITVGSFSNTVDDGQMFFDGDITATNGGRVNINAIERFNATTELITFSGDIISAAGASGSTKAQVYFRGADAITLNAHNTISAGDGGLVMFRSAPYNDDAFITRLSLNNAVSLSAGGEIRFGQAGSSSDTGYRRIELSTLTSTALVNSTGGHLMFGGDYDGSVLVFPENVATPITFTHADGKLTIDAFEDIVINEHIPITVTSGAKVVLSGSETINSSLLFDPESSVDVSGGGSLIDIDEYGDVSFEGPLQISSGGQVSLDGENMGALLSFDDTATISVTGDDSLFESKRYLNTSSTGFFDITQAGEVSLKDGSYNIAGAITVDGEGSLFEVNDAVLLELSNNTFSVKNQGAIVFAGTNALSSQMNLLGSTETVVQDGGSLTIKEFGDVDLPGGFRSEGGSEIIISGISTGGSDINIPGSLVSDGAGSSILVQNWQLVTVPNSATISADGAEASVNFEGIREMDLNVAVLSVNNAGSILFDGDANAASLLSINSDVRAAGSGIMNFKDFSEVTVNADVRAEGGALVNFQGGGNSTVTQEVSVTGEGSFTVAEGGQISFNPETIGQRLESAVGSLPIRFFSEVDVSGQGGGVFQVTGVSSNELFVDSDIYMTGGSGLIEVDGRVEFNNKTVTADGVTNLIDATTSTTGLRNGSLRALNGAGILVNNSDVYDNMSLVWDADSFVRVNTYLDFNHPNLVPGDSSLSLLEKRNYGTIFLDRAAVLEFDDLDNWALAGGGAIVMDSSSVIRAVDAEETFPGSEEYLPQKSWYNVDQYISGEGHIHNSTENQSLGTIESNISSITIRADGIAEDTFFNAGRLLASGAAILDIQGEGYASLLNSGEITTTSTHQSQPNTPSGRGVELPQTVVQELGGYARALGDGVLWDLDLSDGLLSGGRLIAEDGAVIILGGRDLLSVTLNSSAASGGGGGFFEGTNIGGSGVSALSNLSDTRLEDGVVRLTGNQDIFLTDLPDSEALTIATGGLFQFIGSGTAFIYGAGPGGEDDATIRIGGGTFQGTDSAFTPVGARLLGDSGTLDIFNPNYLNDDPRLSFAGEVVLGPGMITQMLAFNPNTRGILRGGLGGVSTTQSQLGGSLALAFDSNYNPFADGINSRLILFEDDNGVTGNWTGFENGSIYSATLPFLGIDQDFDFRVVQDATSVALEIEIARIYLDTNAAAASFGDWSSASPSWRGDSLVANWTISPLGNIATFSWSELGGGVDVDAVLVASSQVNDAIINIGPQAIQFAGKELIVEGRSGGSLTLDGVRINFAGGGIAIEHPDQILDYQNGELEGDLYKRGPGTLRVSSVIGHNSSVSVQEGAFQLSTRQVRSGFQLALDDSSARLNLDASADFYVDSLSGVTGSQIQAVNGHAANLRVRPRATQPSAYSGTLRDGSGTLSLEINSLDNSTARFTMDQSGSDFSGETRITRGTLALENNFVLSPNSRLNITSNGIVEADGNQRVAGLTGAGRYSGSGILEVLNTAGDDSFSGVLNDLNAGTASLRKSGSNRLTLTGNANTYSGTTFIGSGELAITGVHTGGNRYQIENGGRLLGEGGVITLASSSGNGLQVQNGGTFSYASTFDTNGKNVRFDAGSILSIKEFNSSAAATRIGTADFRNVDSFDIADVSTGGLRFDLNVDSGVFSNDRVNIESSASGTLQIGDLGLDQFQLTLNSDVTGQTGTFTLFDSDHTIDGQIDLDNDVIATPDTVPAPRSG